MLRIRVVYDVGYYLLPLQAKTQCKGYGGVGHCPPGVTIRPLVQTDSKAVTNATGCKDWNDCLTCPEWLAAKCRLGR